MSPNPPRPRPAVAPPRGGRKPPPPLSQLARTPRAEEVTGLSRRSLYRLSEEGQITRWKIRGATYWDLEEIARLVYRARLTG